jgi:predicted kinase
MKEYKLLILKGIPASGKSTFAKKLCKDNPKTWIRVCRDDIRSMLGTYWVPNRENLVTELEYSSIEKGFANGYNVVVDATNLNPKTIVNLNNLAARIRKNHLRKLDLSNGELEQIATIKVEYKDFEIPLNKALFRDFKRGLFGGRKVGAKVVKNFYNKYYGKR